MPWALPPRPFVVAKSRGSTRPLTGIGSRPLASTKATAGASRSALPSDLAGRSPDSVAGDRRRLLGFGRGGGGRGVLALQPGDEVAQAGRLAGEGGGALLLVGQRVGRGGSRGALLVQEEGRCACGPRAARWRRPAGGRARCSCSVRSATSCCEVGGDRCRRPRAGRAPRRRAGWRCARRPAHPPGAPGWPAADGWPMRCRAASTSASTSRRWPARRAACLPGRAGRASRCSAASISPSSFCTCCAGIDQRLVEGGAVLVEGVDLLAQLRLALPGDGDVAGDGVELGLAGVARDGCGVAVGGRPARAWRERRAASTTGKRSRMATPVARRASKLGATDLTIVNQTADLESERLTCGHRRFSRDDRGGRRGLSRPGRAARRA